MPTSRGSHLSYLTQLILEIKPKSILDVGVGFGSKGMLFREYTDIWDGNYKKEEWKTIIDGIEIFPDYVSDLQKSIYNKIHIGNALAILPTLGNYDVIYAGDVLEHFNEKQGREFIELLKEHSPHVIITTPVKVSDQGSVFGNEYETHRSQWGKESFPEADIVSFGNIFVIQIIKRGTQKYYCDGMKFYGDKLPFDKYTSIKARTFFLGLYFIQDYVAFYKHEGERVVFWNGSDVSRLLRNPAWLNYIQQGQPATHYCHNKQLQDELLIVGIHAEIMPVFFGYKEDYLPCLPAESPAPVKCFMGAHPGREEEYGVPVVLNIADKMPEAEFHIYGVESKKQFSNVIFHGQVPEEQMDEDMKEYHVCLRLNHHDGLSQIVCKSILMGIPQILSRDEADIIKSIRDIQLTGAYTGADISIDEILDLSELKRRMEV